MSQYGYTISLVDDGGPYVLGESEGFPFVTIAEAIEDAKAWFDQYDGAEIVQVFREPGGSFDHFVAGWSPSGGLHMVEVK